MSTSLRPRPAVALPPLPFAAAVVAFCLGVAAPAQEPPATPATPAVPSATSRQDERPAARTFRTTLNGAKGLDVATVQGAITVRRDPAAAGLEITAVLRRAGGASSRRLNDAEFEACVRGAKLAAAKDDAGNVVARIEFPDAPTTDKDDARRFAERRDSSCEVEFVVRTDGLASVVATSVTGDLRVEGDVGKATLTTVTGDVVVRGTAGAVSAKSVSGDIDLRDAAAAVAASSVSGDVRVGLADAAKDELDLESTSGSIELQLSAAWQGTWRASSTTGTVTVDGRSARAARQRAQDGMGTDAKGTIGDADAARAKLATVTGSIRLTGAANGGQDAQPAPTPAPAAEPEPAPRRRVVRIGGERLPGGAEGEAAAAAQEQGKSANAAALANLAEHGVSRNGDEVFGDATTAAEVEEALRSAAAAVRVAMAESRAAMRAAGEAVREAMAGSREAAGAEKADAEEDLTGGERIAKQFADIGALLGDRPKERAGATQTAAFYRSLSIRIDDDGAVRVEVEQRGDDGKAEKKVYEAPDMATFQRQHPGVLDGAVVTGDAEPRRAEPRARAGRPAK